MIQTSAPLGPFIFILSDHFPSASICNIDSELLDISNYQANQICETLMFFQLHCFLLPSQDIENYVIILVNTCISKILFH